MGNWTIEELQQLSKNKVHDLGIEMDFVAGERLRRHRSAEWDAGNYLTRYYEVIYQCGLCGGEGVIELGDILEDLIWAGDIEVGDDELDDEELEELGQLKIYCPSCGGRGEGIMYEG